MTTGHDLAIALRAAYLALHRRSEAAFESYGVTADQFVLLATLNRGHALTQRELARRMSSDPSTVRAMLVLLERNGLVEQEAHPTDARARFECRAIPVVLCLRVANERDASETVESFRSRRRAGYARSGPS